MTAAAAMTERHASILGELADMGLDLARTLHAAAKTADTPEAAAEFATAFHRVSRSVRQTLALEARLRRDHVRAEREQAEARGAWASTLRDNRTRIRQAFERTHWDEEERSDAPDALAGLDSHLDDAGNAEALVRDDVDAQIARLARQFGLKAAPVLASRAGPEPTARGRSRRPVWNGEIPNIPIRFMDLDENGQLVTVSTLNTRDLYPDRPDTG